MKNNAVEPLSARHLRVLQSRPPAHIIPQKADPAVFNVKPLSQINAYIDQQAGYVTPDAEFIGRLLYQMMARIEGAIILWEGQQHILASAQAQTLSTTEVTIYENTLPYPVTVVVFNLDPAQTIFVGGKGLTVNDSLPIFPEGTDKYTIESGRTLYGRVAAGTVDVRFYTTMKRRII